MPLNVHQRREDDSNFNYVEKRMSSSNPNHFRRASFEWDLISSSVHAIEVLTPKITQWMVKEDKIRSMVRRKNGNG